MGYYSNAGQNIASTEITDIAKLGGAVAGLAHVSASSGTKTDLALANEVKGLGEDEVKIQKASMDLESQQKELDKVGKSITETEEGLAKQQEQYQQLRKETGLNNEAFEQHWQKSKTATDKAKEMYAKSLEEMRKKAELLDTQKKNFKIRKELIDRALERSGK